MEWVEFGNLEPSKFVEWLQLFVGSKSRIKERHIFPVKPPLKNNNNKKRTDQAVKVFGSTAVAIAKHPIHNLRLLTLHIFQLDSAFQSASVA